MEGIFEFSGRQFDLVLNGSELKWCPIKVEISGVNPEPPEEYSVDICEEVIGLKIRKLKMVKNGEKKSVVAGFSLVTLVGENEVILTFNNDCEEIVRKWTNQIMARIKKRPFLFRKSARIYTETRNGFYLIGDSQWGLPRVGNNSKSL